MINEENIDDLLAKYLAEETDQQEADTVSEWVALSEDNQKTFEHSSIIWDKTSLLRTQQKVDVDAAWEKLAIGQKVQNNLQSDAQNLIKALPKNGNIDASIETNRSFNNKLTFKQFFKIAAVLALIAGSFFFLNKNNQSKADLLSFQTGNTPSEKILADGTKVFLNKNSTLSFPEKFDGDFREVNLSGEAFFEVHHDKTHPFIIHANGSDIKVLGTSFNVKAYNAAVQVAVSTGKVQFSKNTQQVILVKGEKAEIIKGQEKIVKSTNIDENILSYKTQTFTFQDASLEEVSQLLSDNFGKPILLEQDKFKNCKLTATFKQESLDNILAIISETFNLKITKQGDSILINGPGCQ